MACQGVHRRLSVDIRGPFAAGSPSYRTEEEMATDFAQANVRTILDFGFTKFLPVEQAAPLHDYGFATQRRWTTTPPSRT